MKIELESYVYADLRLLGQAWRLSDADVVARLIAEFRSSADPVGPVSAGPTEARIAAESPEWIPVHADYEGTRVLGEYNLKTQAVRVIEGIRARRTYKSPSGAAIAVVTELNPRVNPNRNGWTFWEVTATGQTLQHERHR